jgi:hypothetical protein
MPQMMAPVVLSNGQMAFPFIPPARSPKHGHFVIRIEGQYPTAASLDFNQYARFTTTTNVPVVSHQSVQITSQAGKQYWVQSEFHPGQWSNPATFSVSR